jgi:hypothetical protein
METEPSADITGHPLVIRLLGGFGVNDSHLPGLHSDKERWLLAYLILAGENAGERSRQDLADLFWPDLQGRSEFLTQGLWRLRRALQEWGQGWRLPPGKKGSLVRFDLRNAEVDVRQFEAACAEDDLRRAVEIYRGPLMFNVSEANPSEEVRVWAAWERARLEMRLHAARRDRPAVRTAWNSLCRRHEAERELLQKPHQRHLAARWAEPDESPEKRLWFERMEVHAGRANARRRSYEEGRSAASSFPDLAPQPVLEPATGALPLESRFYITRPIEAEFHAALSRRDSVVLLRGARQVGKTSLLARGLQQRREEGGRIACTDLQSLEEAAFESAETLLAALGRGLARQLDLEPELPGIWNPEDSAATNLSSFLLAAIRRGPAPLLWGLDEVDRLCARSFRGEVFGLFRSWHNGRALEPAAGWSQLTLAMVYSTEPRLSIADLNQSPFNVGTKLTLEDFTRKQVAELSRRYGAPLRDHEEVECFYALLGGHPYLVQQGLREIAARGTGIEALAQRAHREDFVFGDHLRRMWAMLSRDPELCSAVRSVLDGGPCPSEESFERLQGAGVLSGDSATEARPRCGLYACYLRLRLL